MNRRDTVIIAVLINAGLLILLFATSLRTDSYDKEALEVAIAPASAEVKTETMTPSPSEALHVSSDPVEQAVREYQTPVMAAAPVDIQPNFALDLQALGSSPSVAAVPEAPAVSTEAPSYKEVKVKKGDVLERIARYNHVSVEELMKFNNLSSTRLKIGQVLKIPSKSNKPSAPFTESAEGAQYYIVKNGDNPWTIAVKNHIKVEDLLRLNHLDEEKARRLKAGDKIRIR